MFPLYLLSHTASPSVLRAVCEREDQFCSPRSIRVAIGTWNVNGGNYFRSVAFKHQPMTEWLLDNPEIVQKSHQGE